MPTERPLDPRAIAAAPNGDASRKRRRGAQRLWATALGFALAVAHHPLSPALADPGSNGLIVEVGTLTSPVSAPPWAESALTLTAGADARALAGTSWVLVSIDGAPVRLKTDASITFAPDGSVSGRAGCNRFTGSYEQSAEVIQFSPMAVTRMACEGAAMATENAVLSVLSGPARITRPDPETLSLRSEADGVLLVYVAAP